MGVIKWKFRGKAQYFCKNSYLFVEIRGANFKDNYGTWNISQKLSLNLLVSATKARLPWQWKVTWTANIGRSVTSIEHTHTHTHTHTNTHTHKHTHKHTYIHTNTQRHTHTYTHTHTHTQTHTYIHTRTYIHTHTHTHSHTNTHIHTYTHIQEDYRTSAPYFCRCPVVSLRTQEDYQTSAKLRSRCPVVFLRSFIFALFLSFFQLHRFLSEMQF